MTRQPLPVSSQSTNAATASGSDSFIAVFVNPKPPYGRGIGSATTLKYSTASFVNGAWTWNTPTTLGSDGRNFVLSKAFQFYTGMEVLHSLDLTPDVQGTSRTSYGHHFAPGTGDCLDQAITTTSKSGTVTFSIPSLCGSADQAQAHID